MDANSIKQAKQRLKVAEGALKTLESAVTFEDAEIAWSTFLSASHTIYLKLENGAIQTGKEGYWRGRMKHKRKKDPLLRYIHHARNSDEHGIDAVATVIPRSAWFPSTLEIRIRRLFTS